MQKKHKMKAQIPPDTQRLLDLLNKAVRRTIERKRRLGHYYVIWRDGKPVAIGDDAPPVELDKEDSQ